MFFSVIGNKTILRSLNERSYYKTLYRAVGGERLGQLRF